MRDYSKVSPALWESKRFHALSDDGRFALLYLMTSPHQNSAGVYRLPPPYAAADLQWPVERVQAALQELSEADMVTVDPDTDVLLIRRWFKHNPPMNQNHMTGIDRLLQRLPCPTIAQEAAASAWEAWRARCAEREGAQDSETPEPAGNAKPPRKGWRDWKAPPR
jgi:hypothetical protein